MRRIQAKNSYANVLFYELIFKPTDHSFFQEAWTIALIAARHYTVAPPKLTILEIFGGTGYMEKFLRERFAAIGIEIEYESLDLFNAKATYQQDVQTFQIGKKYDLIVSTYMSIEACGPLDVVAIFERCYDHLNEGGIFICNRGENRENLPDLQADFAECVHEGKVRLLERPMITDLLFLPDDPNRRMEFNPEYDITYSYRHSYDRLLGLATLEWTGPLILSKDGKKLLRIDAPIGLTFQFLTEKEVGHYIIRAIGSLETVRLFRSKWEEDVGLMVELPRVVNNDVVDPKEDWPGFTWFTFSKTHKG